MQIISGVQYVEIVFSRGEVPTIVPGVMSVGDGSTAVETVHPIIAGMARRTIPMAVDPVLAARFRRISTLCRWQMWGLLPAYGVYLVYLMRVFLLPGSEVLRWPLVPWFLFFTAPTMLWTMSGAALRLGSPRQYPRIRGRKVVVRYADRRAAIDWLARNTPAPVPAWRRG